MQEACVADTPLTRVKAAMVVFKDAEKHIAQIGQSPAMKKRRWITACLPLIVTTLVSTPVRAEQDSEAVFASAARYTVKIETTVRLPLVPKDEQGVFFGAGFVVDARRGWVMTNAHVVQRSPAAIRLKLRGGTWIPARRIYVDPYLDVAIVAARQPDQLSGATVAPLGCKGFPAIGHPVGAFGHPWGLDYTGTRGIVSGLSDDFEAGALLTDAPINSGNSGGPLVSLATGKVVGINTSAIVATGVQNLNFAIAAPYACRVLDLLRAGRDPSPPADTLVFFEDMENAGILKVARNLGSAGDIALAPGDIIKSVTGESGTIARESELMHALRGRLDNVTLRVVRAGKEMTLTGRFPATTRILDRKYLYASGVVLTTRHHLETTEVELGNVLASYVEDGSPGLTAGVRQRDGIAMVDGESIQDLNQIYRLLDNAHTAGKPVKIAATRQTIGPAGRVFVTYREINLPVENLRWVSAEE